MALTVAAGVSAGAASAASPGRASPKPPLVMCLRTPNARAIAQTRHYIDHPDHGRFVRKILAPTISVFLPPAAKATKAAIVICPGGAYIGEAVDLEGFEVARWLNTIGVAGVVLMYRLPRGRSTPAHLPAALRDVQRALRTVRLHAPAWGIDPNRVGLMGFSAGGSLAAMAATHFTGPRPHAKNPLLRFSDRPDFLVLGYPVISMREHITHMGSRQALLGNAPGEASVRFYSDELHVTAATPPTFIVYARDDPAVPNANSQLFYQALRKHHVPAEVVTYAHGGHGFGLGTGKGKVAQWPGRLAQWMQRMHLLSRHVSNR